MAKRIVVAGAGVAGSLVVRGLARGAFEHEVLCFERSVEAEHEESGTGLNIGPNAVKSLRGYFPDLATELEGAGLPWKNWTVCLASGERLMNLDMMRVADNPGLRLRWSDLYRVLRGPIRDRIAFGCEVISAHYAELGEGPLTVTVRDCLTGATRIIGKVDLLIGSDGRFSKARQLCFPEQRRRYLGAALYRLLIPNDSDTLIDDYTQWFHGPHRLLAFRTVDGSIYLAGTLPLGPEGTLSEEMKSAHFIGRCFSDDRGSHAGQVNFLLDAIERRESALHWSRLHDEPILFRDERGCAVLLGDAAHPMVPTIGQGATQAIEDGCVAQEELLRAGDAFERGVESIERRRRDRVSFVSALSWRASDTLLAGSDPVLGTAWKTQPPFLADLAKIYREAPLPN